MSDTPAEPPLVLCEITGRTVPADETVVINGRRVCAEGKAILLERLRGGTAGAAPRRRPPAAVVPLHPGFGLRLGALVIDWMVVNVPPGILGAVIGVTLALGRHGADAGDLTLKANRYTQVAAMAGLLAGFAYYAIMHGTKGRTLGKMACGLRVVNDGDLAPVTPWRAVEREAWHHGPGILGGAATLALVFTLDSPSPLLLAGIGFLPGIYALVSAILSAADGDKQQAIHDRMSKTRVVQAAAIPAARADTAPMAPSRQPTDRP